MKLEAYILAILALGMFVCLADHIAEWWNKESAVTIPADEGSSAAGGFASKPAAGETPYDWEREAA